MIFILLSSKIPKECIEEHKLTIYENMSEYCQQFYYSPDTELALAIIYCTFFITMGLISIPFLKDCFEEEDWIFFFLFCLFVLSNLSSAILVWFV